MANKKISDELLKNFLEYFIWDYTEDESFRIRTYSTKEEESQLYKDEDLMFKKYERLRNSMSEDDIYDLFIRAFKILEEHRKKGIIPISEVVHGLQNAVYCSKKEIDYQFKPQQEYDMIEILLELKWLGRQDIWTMDKVHSILAMFFGIKLGWSSESDHPNEQNVSKEKFLRQSWDLIKKSIDCNLKTS